MHPLKERYCGNVNILVTQICEALSQNGDEAIPEIINISSESLQDIIRKILNALPDHYFYNATSSELQQMITLISRELVLFQVQEDMSKEQFGYNLINFIDGLNQSIYEQFYQNRSEV